MSRGGGRVLRAPPVRDTLPAVVNDPGQAQAQTQAPQRNPVAVEPGTVVADRFEIQALAGIGGFASVYRALDLVGGGVVAVKLLTPRTEVHVERFAREAQILMSLRHPGIVRYLAHGVTPSDQPFLAMEWLEGETLEQRIQGDGLTVAECVTLGARAAQALVVAHDLGVIHRDVKPGNIFLVGRAAGRVKVLDFGIARVNDTSSLTATGMMVGTPGFIAPEQARGERTIDERVDVFALGCVLFKCLTGRAAFLGEDALSVLLKVVLEDAPRVSEFREDVPERLDSLVARMMARALPDRPRDAGAVAAELALIEASYMPGGAPPASLRTAQMPTRLRTLTAAEQRVACFVVARPHPLEVFPERESFDNAPTQAMSVVTYETTRAPITHEIAIESAVSTANASRNEVIQDEVTDEDTVRNEVARTESALSDTAQSEALNAAVTRHGGRLTVLADGSLLVTIVGSGAATDQGARAARCALAMRALLGEVPIALVAGRDLGATRFGEVVDRGMRLLNAGASAGVRLDAATAALLDTQFEIADDAQGLCLRSHREGAEAARLLLGKATPCVGRDRELATLQSMFDECVAEPVARAMLITGQAGVGKSRVRHEFLRALRRRRDPVEIWMARGDSISAGSPFGMLAPAIRRAAGMLDGEPIAVRRQKLEGRVALHVAPDDRARVSEFLGELVGAPFPDDTSVQLRAARRDAMLMGDQMRRAWEDFLGAECRAHPVVVVLEDLHWGDLPTVKLIDGALRALQDQPCMVLALGRPEVCDLFPKLWEERGLQEIRLGELTRKGSEKLVRAVLGDGVAPRTVALLTERAAGNAFYLEELIRAAAEGKQDELPDTVLAMVEGRLAALTPEARRVLRAAAVFGQVFWEDGVRALLGEDTNALEEWLEVLTAGELIEARTRGRFPGDSARRPGSPVAAGGGEYVFRQALVREAAYAMLTESDRALGHMLAGQWLEQAGETDAMVLAEHFERGGQPARAIASYRRAAEHALEGNDLAAVITRADRAIACGAAGETLGALRLLAAEACSWRGELQAALASSVAAMKLLDRGTTRWYAAAELAATASSKLGDPRILVTIAEDLCAVPLGGATDTTYVSTAARVVTRLVLATRIDLADRLLEKMRQAGADQDQAMLDPVVFARLCRAVAARAKSAGDLGTYVERSALAVKSFERAGDLRSVSGQRTTLGYAYLEIGLYELAEKQLREGIAGAERMGLSVVSDQGRQNLAVVLARLGLLDEAAALEQSAVEAFSAQGNRRMEAASRAYLADILSLSNLPVAEHEARRAVLVASAAPVARVHALGILAHILVRQGLAGEALHHAAEGMALLASLHGVDEDNSLLFLAHAQALHATGRVADARTAIEHARKRLMARAASLKNAAWRTSFLERVPENKWTLALARAFRAEGG